MKTRKTTVMLKSEKSCRVQFPEFLDNPRNVKTSDEKLEQILKMHHPFEMNSDGR